MPRHQSLLALLSCSITLLHCGSGEDGAQVTPPVATSEASTSATGSSDTSATAQSPGEYAPNLGSASFSDTFGTLYVVDVLSEKCAELQDAPSIEVLETGRLFEQVGSVGDNRYACSPSTLDCVLFSSVDGAVSEVVPNVTAMNRVEGVLGATNAEVNEISVRIRSEEANAQDAVTVVVQEGAYDCVSFAASDTGFMLVFRQLGEMWARAVDSNGELGETMSLGTQLASGTQCRSKVKRSGDRFVAVWSRRRPDSMMEVATALLRPTEIVRQPRSLFVGAGTHILRDVVADGASSFTLVVDEGDYPGHVSLLRATDDGGVMQPIYRLRDAVSAFGMASVDGLNGIAVRHQNGRAAFRTLDPLLGVPASPWTCLDDSPDVPEAALHADGTAFGLLVHNKDGARYHRIDPSEAGAP